MPEIDTHHVRHHNLLWLTLFAVAMAHLEATVVVYLRRIYYPGGFGFPLVEADTATYLIELGREAATLVMLAAVGRLASSSAWGRFACFAFLIGVWDIGYYVWLEIFLGWPASLLTWDVLFLIPVVWTGPVLAPVLVSLLLIAGSAAALKLIERGHTIQADRQDWWVAAAGALLILYTFMTDAVGVLLTEGLEGFWTYVPERYSWPVFGVGLMMMAGSVVRVVGRTGEGRMGMGK